MAVPTRHASSPAATMVVFIDALPARSKKRAATNRGPACLARNLRPRLLSGRRRLAEVRGAVNFLARVGDRDLRALREIHVRVAALDHPADERDGHARLHRLRAPTELLDQLLRAAELRGPPGCLPARIRHVKDDQRVR